MFNEIDIQRDNADGIKDWYCSFDCFMIEMWLT
jgi:hypothetical protein